MRLGLALLVVTGAGTAAAEWKRHTIDDSSQGADGVRLRDVNGDGLLDIATGWEEGGQVKVYLHPGHHRVKQPWPTTIVGKVRSPEDAVFMDVDGNGIMDVVSSCEGQTRTVFVHWAPQSMDHYLEAKQWKTKAIPSGKTSHVDVRHTSGSQWQRLNRLDPRSKRNRCSGRVARGPRGSNGFERLEMAPDL